MKIDRLQVQLIVGSSALGELYESDVLNHRCNCIVETPSSRWTSFSVLIRDDTTSAADWFDLRASVTIRVDGADRLRTRNCVLLRDHSEYLLSGDCSRKLPSTPFHFAERGVLESKGKSFGEIEVIYTRYHKTRHGVSTGDSRQADQHHDGLGEAGLKFIDDASEEVSLIPHCFTFFYTTGAMTVLADGQHGKNVKAASMNNDSDVVMDLNINGRPHKL